jgi:Beta-galactosidase
VPAKLSSLSALVLMCVASLPGSTTDQLPACARGWGELMVNHELLQDICQQLNRAEFYRASDSKTTIDLISLRERVAFTEHQLTVAHELYAELFRSGTDSKLSQLRATLEAIGSADVRNELEAESLLQRLGAQAAGPDFRAMPVASSELEANWNPGTCIRRDFRPARILFGSTATPGDERVLPLRFDFCKGVFGFYAPMSAPGQIALSEKARNETDGEHRWLREHHQGYHYWAGVYNNQNSYLAPWFRKLHENDDDVWLKLADGKLLKSSTEWAQLNIWNASVQDYLRNYCEAQARVLQDDPFLIGYDYTAEPHPWASQPPEPPHQPQYSGYNDSAIAAFHQWLKEQYADIGELNQKWHTTYARFEDIAPPPDPYVRFPVRATPLSYEFERFRCSSQTRFWRLAYESYRRYDKSKPVIANAGMYMSGWPVEGLDAWQLQQAGVADWIDMHMNNFSPNLPEQIYLYSLCRLSGKVPVQFEYIWTFPRTGPVDDHSEADFRATCLASVWRNLVWGKRALVFFDAAYDWPAYHNAFLDRDLAYTILRPSICVVPVLKRRAIRLNELLFATEIVAPPILVLQPSTSVWNSPPVHPNQGFSFHTTVAAQLVHPLLFLENYSFLYAPEEAVMGATQALDSTKVLILPQAPYLPADLQERLLGWVGKGGTLISIGLPGVWNEYGQPDGRLLRRVFGDMKFEDQEPGHWKWSWNLSSPAAGTRLLLDENGRLAAASRKYGKGTVLVSTAGFASTDRKKLFYDALNKAIGARPATCGTNAFELVLRGDQHHQQYLFVLNPHTRQTREDEISISRRVRSCVDLSVGSGILVPAHVVGHQTKFRLRLGPGESAVFQLR